MARFRRRRSFRKSTRTIMMKFQSFMDISTNDTSMQIITISAGGKEILQRLAPQFGAYKYYKIGNIAVKLVPASTLPVDPTGLSYSLAEGSEMTVDPRDQLTPGMMRITNGEDVFENITGLSADQQHGIYNNMLLDPRWYKWMLQSGVKRHATPRYWQIGQLHQDKWPGAEVNYPTMHYQNGAWVMDGTSAVRNYVDGTPDSEALQSPLNPGMSTPYGFFQTGHRGVLGWLPTDGYQNIGQGLKQPFLASPPEIEVMKIILPRAYKTRYYYRMFITETVYFKEPIVNFGVFSSDGFAYKPIDVFHDPGFPIPYKPTDTGQSQGVPGDRYTGGNYGDD